MKELKDDYPVFEVKGEDENDIVYVDKNALLVDRRGREYIGVGYFLENDDFYQGLNMITVVRSKLDLKFYGFSWWDDISKHGEAYIEANGDEFGLECDTDAEDFDWDEDYVSYYVFEPVVYNPIPGYKYV